MIMLTLNSFWTTASFTLPGICHCLHCCHLHFCLFPFLNFATRVTNRNDRITNHIPWNTHQHYPGTERLSQATPALRCVKNLPFIPTPNTILDTASLQIIIDQYTAHTSTFRQQTDHSHSFHQKECGMKLASFINCSCSWSSERKVMVYLHKVYYLHSIL